MRVFDITFDYKTDAGGKDPDSRSPRLKADHQLLWTKELPGSTGAFSLQVPEDPKVARKNYLMYDQSTDGRITFGSDAITNSYTRWMKLKPLFEGLTDAQKALYLDPPYTIGSAMIWPVRTIHLPTMNTSRGMRLKIADRMDLTLECIRRHYAGEPVSPLADVIINYADFFELFGTFRSFVNFFHFQDLVTPGYDGVKFYLPFNDFTRSGLPKTTEEYMIYREAVLDFIAARGARMADWVEQNRPDVDVVR